ncbi:tRNA modification GTPase [Halobacteriovorax marinus]|uniref:tRNA modification GTPase n=1 Tax=Halobacteriovorax marinus TaxID=97084 RepID=UPI003A9514FB
MLHLYDDRPIIACSTGLQTNSAIGLIRISGFSDLSIFQDFFKIDLANVKARYSHFTSIIDGDITLDEIVLTFYSAPNSYNGENILELGVHGNQINIQRIISLFINSKLVRAAKEGEFSYRALKNKKLTLSQVEGLDLLLNANSSFMLDQGLQVLSGDLHKQYLSLHDSFLKLKSSVEISIDFSEDVGEEQCAILLKESLSEFSSRVTSLWRRVQSDRSDLANPSVSLVGQTNAGKSTLFNYLLANDRSIVSDQAGTTRDYVSEYLTISGNTYRLVDTAGLRETEDNIEKIGIDRAIEISSNSFFKILVVNPLQTNFEDYKSLQDESFDLLIISHLDQLKDFSGDDFLSKLPSSKVSIAAELSMNTTSFKVLQDGSIGPNLKSGSMGAEDLEASGSIGPSSVNGPMGANLSQPGSIGADKSGSIGPLITYIEGLISHKFNDLCSDNPLLIGRHRECVNNIYLSLQEFQSLTENVEDIAIISSELNILEAKVSELIGIVSPDDVLNNIFTNFCIGK